MKTPKGIVARISDADLDWMRDKIAHWRANGVTWFLVQSEIPAIGPNRGSGTSGLLLRNGDKVWRRFASIGVDHANDHRNDDDSRWRDDKRPHGPIGGVDRLIERQRAG